jgi:hypothetical protein
MAITEAEPSLTAQIYVDGAPLEEYENDENVDTPTSTTNYVEATVRAAFEIEWAFTPQFRARHDIKLQITLDGHRGQSHFLSKEQFTNGKIGRLGGIVVMTQNQCLVRKYIFADIDIGMNLFLLAWYELNKVS